MASTVAGRRMRCSFHNSREEKGMGFSGERGVALVKRTRMSEFVSAVMEGEEWGKKMNNKMKIPLAGINPAYFNWVLTMQHFFKTLLVMSCITNSLWRLRLLLKGF